MVDGVVSEEVTKQKTKNGGSCREGILHSLTSLYSTESGQSSDDVGCGLKASQFGRWERCRLTRCCLGKAGPEVFWDSR